MRFLIFWIFVIFISLSLYEYTVTTPDVEFRTYDRMPQDQTVHRAEYVSGLWAARIQLNIRSFPLFSELSEYFPEVSEDFPEVSEGFSGGN